MTDDNGIESKDNTPIKVALIGALATVLVAVITGMFSLMGRASAPSQAPAPVEMQVPMSPTDTPASIRTITDEPTSVNRLLFATQIGPDGRAVDPGSTVPVDTQDLYAVFRPGQTPPGVAIAAENPDPDAYYAFLRPAAGSGLNTFGWRWYKDGEIVNEYEADATATTFWLQRFGGQDGSVFTTLAGAGTYRIVILLDGNPSVSTEVEVVEE